MNEIDYVKHDLAKEIYTCNGGIVRHTKETQLVNPFLLLNNKPTLDEIAKLTNEVEKQIKELQEIMYQLRNVKILTMRIHCIKQQHSEVIR